MGKSSLKEEIEDLERRIREAKREEADRLWASRRCRACGEPDEEQGGNRGYLTDLRITVAAGEEGHSDLKVWLCSYCLEDFTEAMQKLNLTIHAHGGICFLEDQACPGYGKCPTPERQYPGVYWDEDSTPEE